MYVLKSSTKEVDREMDCMYIRWFKQDEHNRTLQNKYITIRFEQEEGPKKAGMIETVMMNKWFIIFWNTWIIHFWTKKQK